MGNPIITVITIISTILSVTAPVGALCLIGYCTVQVARKLYWRYCLKYDAAYIADAEVTGKLFNGKPAQDSDPAPMFDDLLLIVNCKGTDFIFSSEEYYERFSLGQTVKLMEYQGYNRKGDMKRTYFGIEEK